MTTTANQQIPGATILQPRDESSAQSTERIQRAIDETSRNGGGTVILSGGCFVVRTIEIKSGVRLRIEPDAVLQADPDIEAYPMLGEGRRHLLIARGARNCALEGQGTIDGNIDAVVPRTSWGGYEKLADGKRLSPMIRFYDCEDLLVRDVKIINTQGWTLHPFRCTGVRIWNIRIDNPLGIPNSDGIDIEGCRDVQITGCYISTGDDAIIIKTAEHSRSCENIVVSDCVIRTVCIGLGIGTESHWPVRNVSFTNCCVHESSRIIEIGVRDQGLIENITFTNITGATFNNFCPERPVCIHIEKRTPDTVLGAVRNVTIQNLHANTRGRLLFTAEEGATIEHLTLSDIHLTLPEIEDPAEALLASNSSRLAGVLPEVREAKALVVLNNCHAVSLRDVHVTWPEKAAVTAEKRADTRSDQQRAEITEPAGDRANRFRPDIPMNALFLRNAQNIMVDAPFLQPYQGSERIACHGECSVDTGSVPKF